MAWGLQGQEGNKSVTSIFWKRNLKAIPFKVHHAAGEGGDDVWKAISHPSNSSGDNFLSADHAAGTRGL